MIGNSNLKFTAFISLGIHILIISIVSGSFRDPKIHRTATLRNVKVFLQPLVAKENPNAKIIPPIPIKVGNQDREEPVFDREGLNLDSFSTHLPVVKDISLEEPKPISKSKEEEEKTSNEPVNIAISSGSVSDTDSSLKVEGNTVSSKEATSTGGNLSISLPSFRSGESYGNNFSYSSSGDGQRSGMGSEMGLGTGIGMGTGTGSGHTGSLEKGSGKGREIFGKFFSSRGGDNVANPRYGMNPKPTYPKEAMEKGYEGEVVLRVEVLSNGWVGGIEVKRSSGYEVLDRTAITTVKQWKFVPAKKGDASVSMWVNIPMKFQLQ